MALVIVGWGTSSPSRCLALLLGLLLAAAAQDAPPIEPILVDVPQMRAKHPIMARVQGPGCGTRWWLLFGDSNMRGTYLALLDLFKERWPGAHQATFARPPEDEREQTSHWRWRDSDTMVGDSFKLSLRFVTGVGRMAAAFRNLTMLHEGHAQQLIPAPELAPSLAATGGEPAYPDVVFFSPGLWTVSLLVNGTEKLPEHVYPFLMSIPRRTLVLMTLGEVLQHHRIPQDRVDRHNALIRAFARDNRIDMLDFDSLSRGHSDGGFHFTRDGYVKAARAIIDRMCW